MIAQTMQMFPWFVAKLTGEEQGFPPKHQRSLVLPTSVLALGVSRTQEMEGKSEKKKSGRAENGREVTKREERSGD